MERSGAGLLYDRSCAPLSSQVAAGPSEGFCRPIENSYQSSFRLNCTCRDGVDVLVVEFFEVGGDVVVVVVEDGIAFVLPPDFLSVEHIAVGYVLKTVSQKAQR